MREDISETKIPKNAINPGKNGLTIFNFFLKFCFLSHLGPLKCVMGPFKYIRMPWFFVSWNTLWYPNVLYYNNVHSLFIPLLKTKLFVYNRYFSKCYQNSDILPRAPNYQVVAQDKLLGSFKGEKKLHGQLVCICDRVHSSLEKMRQNKNKLHNDISHNI